MRLIILAVCALGVNAAFAAMLLATLKVARTQGAPDAPRRGVAREIFWAAIPWLILLAAATPAVRSLLAEPRAVAAHSSPRALARFRAPARFLTLSLP